MGIPISNPYVYGGSVTEADPHYNSRPVVSKNEGESNMKLIKVGEGKPYDAPRHFNYWSISKLDPESVSKRLHIGVSHFLPGGGAEFSASPLERVYFCVEGKITVKGKTEEYHLEPGDMIYIANGEERSFQVSNTKPATILVIMAKPD